MTVSCAGANHEVGESEVRQAVEVMEKSSSKVVLLMQLEIEEKALRHE